jgi:hypothetical protein
LVADHVLERELATYSLEVATDRADLRDLSLANADALGQLRLSQPGLLPQA